MSEPRKPSRDETERGPSRAGPQTGRPRLWANEAEKHRAHRAKKAQKASLLEALLDAVRNANLEDPQLQRLASQGDDVAVLRGLIAHYEARNWNLTGWGNGKQPMSEEP